jgi:lipopolysaccharide export system permease protein
MSTDNEILVMRSSGLPYPAIFLPVAVIGVLISLISFFANDVLLPAGTLEFGKLYRRLLYSTPAIELESNSVKRFKDTVLITGEVGEGTIGQLMILDKTPAGERRLIVAASAKLEESQDAALTLEIDDAFVHTTTEASRDDYDYATAETLQYIISKQDFIQSLTNPGPREMSSRDVRSEIDKKRAALADKITDRTRRTFDAALALEAVLAGGPEDPGWNGRNSAQARLVQESASLRDIVKDRTLRIYQLEYYKKFSIPFGALTFIFLAIPLGLFARKSGQSVGFGLGLLIAVLYWALLIGGQTLGLRLNYSPFIAMWLPNIVVVVLGLILSLVRAIL